MMGKTIESHDLNAKLHVPVKFFFSTFGKMATKDSVHTGIHAHRHACALHMRVATTVSAMNAKGCARWCHMRPTVRRAVSLKRKIHVPAATALSARILADQVAGGMHPHMTRSSREENMIMTAVQEGGGAKCHPDPTPRTTLSKKPSGMVVSATRHAQSDDQCWLTWPLAHARA